MNVVKEFNNDINTNHNSHNNNYYAGNSEPIFNRVNEQRELCRHVLKFSGSKVRIISPKHIQHALKSNKWITYRVNYSNSNEKIDNHNSISLNNNKDTVDNSSFILPLLLTNLTKEIPEIIELPSDFIASNNSHNNNINKDIHINDESNNVFYMTPELYAVEAGTDLRNTLQNQTDESLAIYHLALLLNNSFAPAYFHLGVVSYERGDRILALNYYSNALHCQPDYVEALCNVGVIYKNSGELEYAIAYYERALHYNANHPIVKKNLSVALCDMGTRFKNDGDQRAAAKSYKRALFYNSSYADAYYNLAIIYVEQCQFEKAIVSYELAIHFRPNYAEAYNNLGVLYRELNNFEAALESYQKAIIVNPNFAQSLNNIGVVYTLQGKLAEAKHYIKRALKVSSSYGEAYNNLGVIYRDEGKIEKAIESYDRTSFFTPTSINAPHNKLLALNYTNRSLSFIFKSHKKWGKNFIKHDKVIKLFKTDFKKEKKITIGYISPDFYTHSVSYFIDGILKYHDKHKFNIICYSNVSKEDVTTNRLKSYQHQWRNIVGKTDLEVSEIIVNDCIDILVDLAGHTCSNRLDVVALKPAPITISYLGYPNTTGLPNVDFKLADLHTDPVNTIQKYTEQLLRLEPCFLTYSPPPQSKSTTLTSFDKDDNYSQAHACQHQPPSETNEYITIGTFNVVSKYSDELLKCWSAIMKRLDTAKLVLKSKSFGCAKSKQSFQERLKQFDIDISRVILLPLLQSQDGHLQMYNRLDIALDTFPYAGTTTTCEALWMGVPVVTLTGNCHAHNVGRSLLSQLTSKLPSVNDLITNSYSEYIDAVVHLSKDRDLLKHYKSTLRQAMSNSSLCDNANFTLNLEKTYQDIWSKYLVSCRSADHI